MANVLCVTLFSALFCNALAADVAFDYGDQGSWPGDCTTGTRQSPVNIQTNAVQSDSSLSVLQFSSGWDTATTNGVFENTAQTVKFTPDSNITTEFPLGTYRFLQVHFHWGPNDTVGSEHTVNNLWSPLEIHFVHQRIANGSVGDSLAVVGVMVEASSDAISGPWASLDASMIPNNTNGISITGFNLGSLLPSNRNPYYHYPGSLTTPGCTEAVQWFVLQETITVPMTYLQQLRVLLGPGSTPITTNYRDTQPLNGRVIRSPGSDALITSASLMAVLSLALLASVFSY